MLVAVASRSQATADAFGAEFDIPHRHGSYEALLADPEVDAVYISTPHPLHAEWAIKAAEAGKHILCEKPLTLNHAQAMAVIEAARDNDVFLMEAFMYRCHPQTQRLTELVRDAIGRVRLIRADFSFRARFDAGHRLFNNALGGGGILDVGGYPVSLARLIAGAVRGQAYADPVTLNASGTLNAITGVDEYAVATLDFGDGLLAQVASGVSLSLPNRVEVFGDEGLIRVDQPWVPVVEGGQTEIVIERAGGREVITVDAPNNLYAYEADEVAAHLAARQAPAMSWADSLGNARTLDRWRTAIGLTYAQEQADAPEMRRPLTRTRRPALPPMAYGQIAGLGKPVSRLMIGSDSFETLTHGSVMLDEFVACGGNAIDTAYIYIGGQGERVVGQWLRNRGVREQVVILAKGAHTPYCTPEDLDRQFTISLERMQLEAADLYCLHRDNPDVPVGEFVDVLNEHVRAGRLRVFGGSNWSAERIDAANAYAAQHGLQGFGLVSNQFSLARMVEPPWDGCISASTPEMRAWLAERQLPLLAWSSQARGFFLPHVSPDYRGDPELARCWFAPDNFHRRRRAQALAERHGVSMLNIALAYVLAQPFLTFPLIGPRSLHELRTSLPALSVTLSADDVVYLDGQ